MKTITCTECGKIFKSLGYARHRAMHCEHRGRLKEKCSQNAEEIVDLLKKSKYCIDSVMFDIGVSDEIDALLKKITK